MDKFILNLFKFILNLLKSIIINFNIFSLIKI